jgi:3-oxocholest-4-en-26-oate---CoA ligase
MAELLYADVWESIALAIPDRVAQLRGERSLTWRDFDRRAEALAQHLIEAGLPRHARVGTLLFNAPEYLESLFAAFKVGLTPFNMNYRYGPEELLYLLHDADAAALIFHASLAPALERIRERAPGVRSWVAVPEPGLPLPEWAVDYETIAARPSARRGAPWGRSLDDCFFIYTGGTTGMPKGVVWRQCDMLAAMGGGGNLELQLSPLTSAAEAGERARQLDGKIPPGAAISLIAAPLMHGTGQFLAFITLTASGTLAFLPSNRFDAELLWGEASRLRAGTIGMVGTAFAGPMLQTLRAGKQRWDLSQLRRIASSGTIWSAENKRGLLELLPQLTLIDNLGSSEAVGIASATTSALTAAETARFAPTPWTAVFGDDGRRVAPGSGQRGLLAYGGPLPLGYHKDPQKSAQTFRTYEGRRWSVPGDWATVEADGAIALLGRGSLVINTGGEKVFPEEVEEVIKRYPGVRDAAVVGLPDERFGERICAVVELEPGISVTLAQLNTHVKGALASFKAPRQLLLAAVERQPNGKLDYAAVRALALASAS